MSRKAAYVLLVLSLILGTHVVWQTGVLASNTVVLKALACTCPDYRVDLGVWNLSSPLLDTVANLDRSEVYVTGKANPWNSDYRTMFDFMVARGEVVGVDRVSNGDPWNPVLRVDSWDHVSEFSYPAKRWGSVLLFLAGSLLLWLSHQPRKTR